MFLVDISQQNAFYFFCSFDIQYDWKKTDTINKSRCWFNYFFNKDQYKFTVLHYLLFPFIWEHIGPTFFKFFL